jgi:hypothetical protein
LFDLEDDIKNVKEERRRGKKKEREWVV